MHTRTIKLLLSNLEALGKILAKAEAHCEQRKIDKAYMLTARLAPDMFSFCRQVQLTTDFAKGCAARLSNQAVPSYADDEKSFEELHARLRKTADFLKSVSPAALQGAETRMVSFKSGGKDVTFSGEEYFNGYVLPNFFFHMTTAYNILRHNGLELGKGDFLGRT